MTEESTIIIDDSSLKDMLEGNEESEAEKCFELLAKIKTIDNQGKMKVITNTASFLRALWRCEKIDLQRLHTILDVLDIGFLTKKGFAVHDFKNETKVKHDIINLANAIADNNKTG